MFLLKDRQRHLSTNSLTFLVYQLLTSLVVRTLIHSTLGELDLSKEPIVLSVPNTNGRYYLMPKLDVSQLSKRLLIDGFDSLTDCDLSVIVDGRI